METDPFVLIQKGNNSEDAKDYFSAADFFRRASIILQAQAQEMKNTESKIAALYKDQSCEYLFRARKSLISAIDNEYEQDRKHFSELPTTVDMISLGKDVDCGIFETGMEKKSPEELDKRLHLFQKLFATLSADLHQAKNQEAAALSLEERLAQLNSSLPPTNRTPNTDEERMKERMKDLGVFVPPSAHVQDVILSNTMNHDKEVEQIMSMAKDEALLEKGTTNEEVDDVMTLLKNSSIRIDVSDYEGNYQEIYGNDNDDYDNRDNEVEFWKHVVTNNDKEDIHDAAVSETDNQSYEIKTYLEKVQQLLLQASLSMEENSGSSQNYDEKRKESMDGSGEEAHEIENDTSHDGEADKDITGEETEDSEEDANHTGKEENETDEDVTVEETLKVEKYASHTGEEENEAEEERNETDRETEDSEKDRNYTDTEKDEGREEHNKKEYCVHNDDNETRHKKEAETEDQEGNGSYGDKGSPPHHSHEMDPSSLIKESQQLLERVMMMLS